MKSPQLQAPVPTARGESPARILLVDDNEANLLALEALLEGIDVAPVRARSAQEAFGHLLHGEFALLVLDVRMPEMGGFEIARLVRNQPRHKDLPIIFATALESRSEEIEDAYALGAVDFLKKPIGAEAFRSKVRTFVELYRSRRDLERRVADRTAELEATAARLRLLAEVVRSSGDAVVTKTLEGRITSWNAAAETMFGYSSSEVVGRPVTILIPDDRLHEEEEILAKIARGESLTHFETVRRRKDGSLIEVSETISPVRDQAGVVIGASKVARDITERKRVDAALRESRAELQAELADVTLLQKVGAEMIREGDARSLFGTIMDAATQIMESQFASVQMLCERGNGKELQLLGFRGFSPEAAKFWEYVRADSSCTCGVALRTGRRVIAPDVERCDFMAGTKDLDSYLRTGIRAVQTTPLFSRNGVLVGAISTHWNEPHEPSERDLRLFDILARQAADLIERRRAEEELRNLNAQLEGRVRERTASLEEMVRELNTFAYTVAHDLRAPLRALHQYSDLLLEDHASGLVDEGREYLRRIAGGAARMDTLILDLLSYSRVARADVRLGPVDVSQVISRVLDDLNPLLLKSRSTVKVKSEPLGVTGDPTLLSQSLSNLILNAIKFVPAGNDPEVVIAAKNGGDHVRLSVTDRGIGIAPEHQARLFKLFERLHPDGAYPGTGMGLAIVKRAVERMSGQVGVKSELGKGSTFWIELRKAPQ